MPDQDAARLAAIEGRVVERHFICPHTGDAACESQRGILLTKRERDWLVAEVKRLTADLAAAREENAKWSKCDSLVCPYEQRMREAESQLAAATEARERLWEALVESVKLQAHYAGLLNQYDGGQRIIFANADEWIARLAKLKSDAQRPVGPADKE